MKIPPFSSVQSLVTLGSNSGSRLPSIVPQGMEDWSVANITDPALGGGIWVYKTNPNFPGIHFSQSVDNPNQSHMAYNDSSCYYYGATHTFNPNCTAGAGGRQRLQQAWNDYYTV